MCLRVSQKRYLESHSYSKYALGTYRVPETVLVPGSETHDTWHSAPQVVVEFTRPSSHPDPALQSPK